MPIPARPSRSTPTSVAVALFRQLHEQIRDELAGADDELVNYIPIAGCNSIATIVAHLTGSEAETFQCVAGTACERDRPGEFTRGPEPVAAVLEYLNESDRLLEELSPAFTEEKLLLEIALPTLPPEELRPGITWLFGNYGHAREHVGHIQLTRQLYDRRG